MYTQEIPHQRDQAHAISEFIGANELLADPTVRRDYFEHLTQEDFIDLVQRTNALLRNDKDIVHQHFDGEEVGLIGHEVPDANDKEALLLETWQAATNILRDRTLDDKSALAYAGLTVAGAILYIHPFSDGNGRTSRALSYMLIEGDNPAKDEDLSMILGEDGNSEWFVAQPFDASEYNTFNVTNLTGKPSNIIWGNEGKKYDMAVFDPDNPVMLATEGIFRGPALHKFLDIIDETGAQVLKKYITVGEDGKTSTLDAQAALSELVSMPGGGIGYAAQLLKAGQWARAEYVRAFLRSMQATTRVTPAGGLSERIAVLRSASEQDDWSNAMVGAYGKYVVNGQITPRDHSLLVHEAYSPIVRGRTK